MKHSYIFVWLVFFLYLIPLHCTEIFIEEKKIDLHRIDLCVADVMSHHKKEMRVFAIYWLPKKGELAVHFKFKSEPLDYGYPFSDYSIYLPKQEYKKCFYVHGMPNVKKHPNCTYLRERHTNRTLHPGEKKYSLLDSQKWSKITTSNGKLLFRHKFTDPLNYKNFTVKVKGGASFCFSKIKGQWVLVLVLSFVKKKGDAESYFRVLDVDPSVKVPPAYSFNDNELALIRHAKELFSNPKIVKMVFADAKNEYVIEDKSVVNNLVPIVSHNWNKK